MLHGETRNIRASPQCAKRATRLEMHNGANCRAAHATACQHTGVCRRQGCRPCRAFCNNLQHPKPSCCCYTITNGPARTAQLSCTASHIQPGRLAGMAVPALQTSKTASCRTLARAGRCSSPACGCSACQGGAWRAVYGPHKQALQLPRHSTLTRQPYAAHQGAAVLGSTGRAGHARTQPSPKAAQNNTCVLTHRPSLNTTAHQTLCGADAKSVSHMTAMHKHTCTRTCSDSCCRPSDQTVGGT